MVYHIFLIITDGEIHDMPETKNLIVQAAKLPMSIIIVGVGNEEFLKMKELDADENVLKNSSGVAAARDIVQFVRFRDFAGMHQGESLAEEVLKEVPDQLVNYMMAHAIKPQPPQVINVDQFIQ